MIRKLSRQEFIDRYKKAHDSVFSGREVMARPFEHLEWEFVLVPGRMHIPSEVMSAIREGAQVCGDQDIIISDCEAPMTLPHHETVLLSIDDQHSFWEIGEVAPMVNAVDSHVFGPSGRWGMIRYYEDFSCVGGERLFMSCFLERLGGREAVKDRFLRFNEEGWAIDDDYKKQLLKTVGWD